MFVIIFLQFYFNIFVRTASGKERVKVKNKNDQSTRFFATKTVRIKIFSVLGVTMIFPLLSCSLISILVIYIGRSIRNALLLVDPSYAYLPLGHYRPRFAQSLIARLQLALSRVSFLRVARKKTQRVAPPVVFPSPLRSFFFSPLCLLFGDTRDPHDSPRESRKSVYLASYIWEKTKTMVTSVFFFFFFSHFELFRDLSHVSLLPFSLPPLSPRPPFSHKDHHPPSPPHTFSRACSFIIRNITLT